MESYLHNLLVASTQIFRVATNYIHVLEVQTIKQNLSIQSSVREQLQSACGEYICNDKYSGSTVENELEIVTACNITWVNFM